VALAEPVGQAPPRGPGARNTQSSVLPMRPVQPRRLKRNPLGRTWTNPRAAQRPDCGADFGGEQVGPFPGGVMATLVDGWAGPALRAGPSRPPRVLPARAEAFIRLAPGRALDVKFQAMTTDALSPGQ
jgi:hypothetical protein